MRKLFAIAAGLLLVGCAVLQPGADPLVVRTEQALTTTGTTFDLVLRVDNADRGFWKTNAPAFHEFCEWLRTPTPYIATADPFATPTNVPRCIAMQLNVDDLKLAYQSAKNAGNSNALYLSLITFQAAARQAGSWSTIVTNKVHP